MRRSIPLWIVALLVSIPAWAGFRTQELGEGFYFVEYERGRMLSGGVLDTGKKVQKKLHVHSHEFCLEEGYTHIRFMSPLDIAGDEKLLAMWKMLAGELGSTLESDDRGGWMRHHETRALVKFSHDEQDGFDKCESKKKKK